MFRAALFIRLNTNSSIRQSRFKEASVLQGTEYRAAGEEMEVAPHVLKSVLCAGSKMQSTYSVLSCEKGGRKGGREGVDVCL